MAQTRQQYIKELRERRAALLAQYDAITKEPASYSVSGSVSATNRSLEDLRKEIAAIEGQLASALGMAEPGGIVRRWPDYSRRII